jgi:hypothetical protein
LTGPAGLLLVVAGGFATLKQRIEEFNEQPINLADKVQQDLADIENIERDDFSVFNFDNLLAGYQSLSEYFGWGDEAAEDFEVIGGAGEEAANKIAAAAKVIGQDSPPEIAKLSQAAIDAAVQVGAAANNIEDAFGGFDTPLIDQIVGLPGLLSDAEKAIEDGGAGINATAEQIRTALGRVEEAFVVGDIGEDQYRAMTTALLALRDSSSEAAISQEALAGEVLTTEEAILKARQAVLDQTLALQELASDERIRNLELGVDLKVEQIENDTQRIETAFESVNLGIQSTADVLNSLNEIRFGDDIGLGDQFTLDRQIRQEQERRQQEFDLQKELTEAQIESMRARTQALQSGEGLIKIESDGLEPALEMIMWQVLEKVQLRANAEGAEFLLGING